MNRPRKQSVKVLGTCDGKAVRTTRGQQLVTKHYSNPEARAKEARHREFMKNSNEIMLNKVLSQPRPVQLVKQVTYTVAQRALAAERGIILC